MLIFETRPLGTDACKPKLGFRLGSRSMSGSIFCLRIIDLDISLDVGDMVCQTVHLRPEWPPILGWA